MKINIQGASENNLKHLDVTFNSGLTVVTGVSGSGKSSLVFDTLYHESKRRFMDLMTSITQDIKLQPAKVDRMTGLLPSVAIDQNVLNRNPNSSVATASGIHPFLRILLAKFGSISCVNCKTSLQFMNNDEIVQKISLINQKNEVLIATNLVTQSYGSHKTLLESLQQMYPNFLIEVDNKPYTNLSLNPQIEHMITITVSSLPVQSPNNEIRNELDSIIEFQTGNVVVKYEDQQITYPINRTCPNCGIFIPQIESKIFHQRCINCNGDKCEICNFSGLNPPALGVVISGKNIIDILGMSIHDAEIFFQSVDLPISANRILEEIIKRLSALRKVELGYITLERPSPSLSRGESQRVKLANLLVSELEDLLCVLDEPTIGLHPQDVMKLLPRFRELPGSVVYVEHDRLAAAFANHAYDLGPEGGNKGGNITFQGNIQELWSSNTISGEYFSKRKKIPAKPTDIAYNEFFKIIKANFRNLKEFSIKIPYSALILVCGVSGSGKTTLVRDVIVESINAQSPVNCQGVENLPSNVIFVNQDPIGKNSRSNPSTYTNLAKYIRKIFSNNTDLPESFFSFNTKEGACNECNGLGEIEVKMKYLASNWIRCSTCDGQRFNEHVLSRSVDFGDRKFSISEFLDLSIQEARELISKSPIITPQDKQNMSKLLKALTDIGLGYLSLGQPSPSLSGGESQRMKLAKFLGKTKLNNQFIILDEPTTGLHPFDLGGLIKVLHTLISHGATILVIEHNLDLISQSDWIIELGPGSGANGGEILFCSSASGFSLERTTPTGSYIANEEIIISEILKENTSESIYESPFLRINNAFANNLKGISLEIPKNQITVITGVSGSGKSSLLSDVIELEGKKRFYETLSIYERQGTKETQSSKVDNISGMPVTISLTPEISHGIGRLRLSIGDITEITHHLSVIFALEGKRVCPNCKQVMTKTNHFACAKCHIKKDTYSSKYFNPSTYGAACLTCQGIGSLNVPVLSKLIKDPAKPICDGAIYSPGYFPRGYFCKAPSWGKKMLDAIGELHDFNPETTPWEEIPESGKNAFLYGVKEPLHIEGKAVPFKGFFGIVRDWDVGGTFTDKIQCPDCKGSKFRPEILQITISNRSIHQINISEIQDIVKIFNEDLVWLLDSSVKSNYESIMSKLEFMQNIGLGYLTLDRKINTLSAGEAQRVKIARILDSDFTNLLILLDEPTRGLHIREITALNSVLHSLRDQGNTIFVVEHDPFIIQNADFLVEMGPKSGKEGGQVIFSQSLKNALEVESSTTDWISRRTKFDIPKNRRNPVNYLEIIDARAYNLKHLNIKIPLQSIVGICGVSGSGKSVAMIDILSRALINHKMTTSVAHYDILPAEHEEIIGAPERTILVDQSKKEIRNPGHFLSILKDLKELFIMSEEALAMQLDKSVLMKDCENCKGKGQTILDMGFLPNIREECEVCEGTGLRPEFWDLKINNRTLPELYASTFLELQEFYTELEISDSTLELLMTLGLGYLVLKQPSISLSGGEAQRLKIIKELAKKRSKPTLYIFDEPTVGLHLSDLPVLLNLFNELVGQGNSVIVIEHSLELLIMCDYLIEFGPEGGYRGGYIVAEGTPEELAIGSSPTAPYIRECLERNS